MKQLKKIYFLIHGFCYACMNWGRAASQLDNRIRPYLERECVCAEGWSSQLAQLAETEALVIIPAGRVGLAADYYAAALSSLGDRCFMLDAPDCLVPEFWSDSDCDHDHRLLGELQAAFVHQQLAWNKEELHTALHSLACCRQFRAALTQRGLSYDPATVTSEAWGASFDGCVTKYSLSLRRMLGLANVVEINFGLTVPDAFFLLSASIRECVVLDNGLRLFLFEHDNHVVGLYTCTTHSLADPPARVTLTGAPETVTVRSKQGIRLWPQPQEYALPGVPIGYHEPPQVLVQREDNELQFPVSAGFVYRLAKAPAYVFMPDEMSYAEARSILISAEPR